VSERIVCKIADCVCEGADLACSSLNNYRTDLFDWFSCCCINTSQGISRADIPLTVSSI
jgi:hypothetical protein